MLIVALDRPSVLVFPDHPHFHEVVFYMSFLSGVGFNSFAFLK